MERPAFTLGIEEEFQIIDPETRELRSHVQEILEEGKLVLKERVKPEMHQSVIEIGTGICRNIQEVRQDVAEMRTELFRLAKKNGMRIAAAGTHPFSQLGRPEDHPDERYDSVVEDMQQLARANLIFGLHVHVGIADRELAIQIMNKARYFLPHILALSTNSPFWLGRNTGPQELPHEGVRALPPHGHPRVLRDARRVRRLRPLLVKTNSIDNAKKIWWDVRPHPFFDTIEFRVCDMPMRLEETVALAALFQAICVKLYKLRLQNLGFRRYRRALIIENKWRASRYGIDGKLIDFGKEVQVPFRSLVDEMLEFVDDVVDELGSRKEVEAVNWILENGTGADRQLRVYESSGGDLKKVVDYICEETEFGLPTQTPLARTAS